MELHKVGKVALKIDKTEDLTQFNVKRNLRRWLAIAVFRHVSACSLIQFHVRVSEFCCLRYHGKYTRSILRRDQRGWSIRAATLQSLWTSRPFTLRKTSIFNLGLIYHFLVYRCETFVVHKWKELYDKVRVIRTVCLKFLSETPVKGGSRYALSQEEREQ